MHKTELAAIIEKNFVVVEIDLGREDKNLDLAEKYHVPISHGIPALAVLDSHGSLCTPWTRGSSPTPAA